MTPALLLAIPVLAYALGGWGAAGFAALACAVLGMLRVCMGVGR